MIVAVGVGEGPGVFVGRIYGVRVGIAGVSVGVLCGFGVYTYTVDVGRGVTVGRGVVVAVCVGVPGIDGVGVRCGGLAQAVSKMAAKMRVKSIFMGRLRSFCLFSHFYHTYNSPKLCHSCVSGVSLSLSTFSAANAPQTSCADKSTPSADFASHPARANPTARTS